MTEGDYQEENKKSAERDRGEGEEEGFWCWL